MTEISFQKGPDEATRHARYESFVGGTGTVLDKQALSILKAQDRQAKMETPSGLPQREELLEQLRTDTNASLRREARHSAPRMHGKGDGHERERSVLENVDKVRSYTPAQMKDVNSLATAMEKGDSKAIESMVAKYKDAPGAFEKLDLGLQLELERRGDKDKIQTMLTQQRDDTDHMRPFIYFHTAQDKDVRGTVYPSDFHYYK